MRKFLTMVGSFKFEESPGNGGFIGGTIYATNMQTRETLCRTYKRLHNGHTNKWEVLGQMIKTLVPPKELAPQKKKVDKKKKI
jgi:hypothetical protein